MNHEDKKINKGQLDKPKDGEKLNKRNQLITIDYTTYLSAQKVVYIAHKSAKKANKAIQNMRDMVPIAQQVTVKNVDNRYIKKLQATIPIDHQPTTGMIKFFSSVHLTGIMPTIRDCAYKLHVYILAIKIALENPDIENKISKIKHFLPISLPLLSPNRVLITNLIELAMSIMEYSSVLFDKNELTNCVNLILRDIDLTISKNYPTHIVKFLEETTNLPTKQILSQQIMDMLKCVFQYANATIDEIDNKYSKIDDVFFDEDHFTYLYSRIFDAFQKVNGPHYKEFKNKYKNDAEYITNCKQICFLNFDEEKNFAISAREAYLAFAEYFEQFIPTIQGMFCNSYRFIQIIQPTNKIKYYLDGIAILNNDLEKALKRLNKAY